MSNPSRQDVLNLLLQDDVIKKPSAKRLAAMCHDPSAKISEGGATREHLLNIYRTRLMFKTQLKHGQEVGEEREEDEIGGLMSIVSALEEYSGNRVRIIAVTTSVGAGGIFVSTDGTVLGVLSN